MGGRDAAIWIIISGVIAIIGAIVLYCTFLKSKNDGKFKGFAGWLYDFLTFKKMCIDALLRVCYLISAIFITLASFSAGSVLNFFLVLLVGNLAIRIAYEFCLILLVICRNTTDISKKLSSCKEEVKNESQIVE